MVNSFFVIILCFFIVGNGNNIKKGHKTLILVLYSPKNFKIELLTLLVTFCKLQLGIYTSLKIEIMKTHFD